MYIVKRENGYAVQTEPSDAIAHISAPIVEENGKEFVLSPTEEGYAGQAFSAPRRSSRWRTDCLKLPEY